MKQTKIKIVSVLFSITAFLSASAQTAQNGSVIITGTRFTYPLVNEWITGFKQKYPDVTIRILQKGENSPDTANLFISGHKQTTSEIKPGYHLTKVSRYAVLPITNEHNPWIATVAITGIGKERLQSIFFDTTYNIIDKQKDIEAKQKIEFKTEYPINLYTREQKGCAPIAFANFYDLNQGNIKGKRIEGDDKALIAAVSKDTTGVTYNNPGYIYNLKTRKVQSPLAILPIDQNGNGKLDDSEKIYDNLDEFLSVIESGKFKNIPTEYVTFAIPDKITSENSNLKLFLEYVLTEGQKSSHQYGFINLLPDDNHQFTVQN